MIRRCIFLNALTSAALVAGVWIAHAQAPQTTAPAASSQENAAGSAADVRVTRGPAAPTVGQPPAAASIGRIIIEEKTGPTTTTRQPGAPEPNWPKTLPEQSPALSLTQWKREEIDAGRARCKVLLTGSSAVTTPSEPMRDGECGAPAPVELHSIGTNPRVTFPAGTIVTCEMVVALDNWLRSDVQPAARSLLGSPIVRAEVMSSYSCRKAYGRKLAKLSEHGRANALDISSFRTEKGDHIEILSDWGMTERDIKAHIAAAKAEEARTQAAAKKEAAKVEAIKRTATAKASESKPTVEPARDAAAPASRAASGRQLRGTIAEDTTASTSGQPSGNQSTVDRAQNPALGLTQPSRLGGPKEVAVKSAATNNPNTADPMKPKELFLRKIHEGACRLFATILGPEANDAHRNHFHIDLAERRTVNAICE